MPSRIRSQSADAASPAAPGSGAAAPRGWQAGRGWCAKRGSSARPGSPIRSQSWRTAGRSPPRSSVRRRPSRTPHTARSAGRPCRTGPVRRRSQRRGQLIGDQREGGVEQGDVDLPPAAGGRPLVQRRDDSERGPDACADVDHRCADAHPGTVGLAGDADQPREGLQQRVVSRLRRRAGRCGRTRRSSSRRASDCEPAERRRRGRGPPPCRRASTGRRRRRRRRVAAAPPCRVRPSDRGRATASSGSRRRTSRCRPRRSAGPRRGPRRRVRDARP